MTKKEKNKQLHWSDRHWKLITFLAVVSFVGSIAFLWIMGPALN